MIKLEEYQLDDLEQWNSYVNYFDKYIKEVSLVDGFEYFNVVGDLEYKNMIMKVVNRKENKFHICKVMKDNKQIGFVDYITYVNENGKSLIGNFFIDMKYRSNGYGTKVFNIVKEKIIALGGKYIDVTPSKRALNLYLRNGFIKTDDISLENGDIVYRLFLNK